MCAEGEWRMRIARQCVGWDGWGGRAQNEGECSQDGCAPPSESMTNGLEYPVRSAAGRRWAQSTRTRRTPSATRGEDSRGWNQASSGRV
jgi:hypothetical protein